MDWIAIDHYEVALFNKNRLDDLPRSGRDLARVTFYGRDRCIGAAHFFEEGTPRPDAELEYVEGHPERPVITLSYPMDMLAVVIDLVRNEAPVWLYFANPNHCGLSTGKELTGEEETDRARERRSRRR